MDSKKARQCFECRNGEHSNYDEDVRLTTIRDGKKIAMRGYVCLSHRTAFEDDGYSLTVGEK